MGLDPLYDWKLRDKGNARKKRRKDDIEKKIKTLKNLY